MVIKLKGPITVTSALPYVNGVKHLGNLIGSILPADIFHRFLDLLSIENVYICGTDEHGTAIEIGASEEGITTEAYVKKYYEMQKQIYDKWNFDFTLFGGTSSKNNYEITQDLFLAINKNGYIQKQELTLPYCKHCDRFLPDRYVMGICPHCNYDSAKGDQCEMCGKVLDPIELVNPKCTVCKGSDIEFRKEKHLFLDLEKLQPKLKKWVLGNKHWPDNTRNFALGWINDGLKSRCITRNLKWGIKVPLKGYEHLVFYVWFDAPIGYISITKDAFDSKKIKDWKKFWSKNSCVYHFLGKDNIPFHTIIWPGILIASGKYTLPYHVEGYEYLNWENQKFSTSKGIGLFSDEALDLFPSDYWRFYLSSILPETKDSNFDWEEFKNKINSELIGNYGNLFYRATYFIEKNFEGAVPLGKIGSDEKELQKKITSSVKNIEKFVEDVKLKDALKEIMLIASDVNRYFQKKEPWAKLSTDKQSVATTLYTAVNALADISTLLYPYTPDASSDALNALGVQRKKWKDLGKQTIKPGHKIKAKILFKKIEELDDAKAYKTRYGKEISEKRIEESSAKIPCLRVATITDVSDHPNADKLYLLELELGTEKRKLVAGLRSYYKAQDLMGKQIIIVANLEPRVLRGIESKGMLLATEEAVILSPTQKVSNGSHVNDFFTTSQINYEDFKKFDIHIEDTEIGHVAMINGHVMKIGDVVVAPEKKVKHGSKVY